MSFAILVISVQQETDKASKYAMSSGEYICVYNVIFASVSHFFYTSITVLLLVGD
jgi:hypothetical protein